MSTHTIEHVRQLLYPMGLIPLIAFSARFLIQWWQSEKAGKTVVPLMFWYFSIVGNALFAAHAFIQLHFPLYFFQVQQATLAWRNVNLTKNTPLSFSSFIKLLFAVAGISFFLYFSQMFLFGADTFFWIRSPRAHIQDVSFSLHLLGCLAIFSYSIRFWVQWWEAETARESVLLTPFWWISITGALLSAIYFILLQDWVNVIGPLFSLIPYARNLCLNKKADMPLISPCDIALIAGETSGDLLGEKIAKQFLLKNSEIRLAGIAGSAMRKAGVTPWLKSESFQVMGFFDVLRRVFFLHRSIQKLTKYLIQTSPRAVLFIDQPSFSLRVAKKLRKQGFSGKIIQVVAPTVWAYKKERVDSFAALFDLILPLFRFECVYFQDKMPTTWVGHPIIETLSQETLLQEPMQKHLALFPGSRETEIRKNLPLQLEAAMILLKSNRELIPAVVVPDMMPMQIRTYVAEELETHLPQGILVPFEQRYRLMQESRAAVTKSGTVTLELALFKVPFVCFYKTGFLTRLWLKSCCRITTTLFALPNIFSAKEIFPEHILHSVSAKNIAIDLAPYISGEKKFPESVTATILENIDTKDSFGKRVVDAVESFS